MNDLYTRVHSGSGRDLFGRGSSDREQSMIEKTIQDECVMIEMVG